jgi:hypothetical protein
MFDAFDRTHLAAALVVGVVVSMALQGRPPDTRAAIPVHAAVLPDMPESALPDGAPAQIRVAAQTVDLGGGFSATLMYGYALEGEVVTRRDFWTDAASAASPLDLGIVWGSLGEGRATDSLSFRAGHRAVWYRPKPGADLPDSWEDQVTNNHLVPASDAVRNALLEVTPGDRVRLRGYLVTVTGEDLAPWRSSTRRDDNTIFGGCEIILVREVEILARATTT